MASKIKVFEAKCPRERVKVEKVLKMIDGLTLSHLKEVQTRLEKKIKFTEKIMSEPLRTE